MEFCLSQRSKKKLILNGYEYLEEKLKVEESTRFYLLSDKAIRPRITRIKKVNNISKEPGLVGEFSIPNELKSLLRQKIKLNSP